MSIKTVSRVLNQEPYVAEATRERVEAAVRKLRYSPHPSARILAGTRTYLIALLYDNPSKNYLMEIELGALEACRAHHYHLMLAPLAFDAGDLGGQLESLVSQLRLDGALLTPPLTDHPSVLKKLGELKLPYASISARKQNQRIGVKIDERAAVREMMAHLVELGHRRIAHITGHPDHGASEWRLEGYRDGLRTAGLSYDREVVVDGLFSHASGRQAANRLLDLRHPPTAIFAANDDMAAGVISAVCERGLSVPGDISVCGFDDTPIARHIYPPLTTIRQPSQEMGKAACAQLLHAIRDRSAGETIEVPYTLKIRRSTGPARSE